MYRFNLCVEQDTVLPKHDKYPAALAEAAGFTLFVVPVSQAGREYIQGEKGVMNEEKRIYVKTTASRVRCGYAYHKTQPLKKLKKSRCETVN